MKTATVKTHVIGRTLRICARWLLERLGLVPLLGPKITYIADTSQAAMIHVADVAEPLGLYEFQGADLKLRSLRASRFKPRATDERDKHAIVPRIADSKVALNWPTYTCQKNRPRRRAQRNT
jgi:hypothetical protein